MLGSSMFDLYREHPLPPHVQYFSFRLLATPHKSINRFLWRAPTLWWVIKAYLHSALLKGSEAPERRCVWSDISVPLHSSPCCHDLSYTIKKKTRTSALSQCHQPDHVSHTCELPLLFDGWRYQASVVCSSWQFKITLLCVWSHRWVKIKQKTQSSLPAESLEIMFPLVSLFSVLTWDHLKEIKDGEIRLFKRGKNSRMRHNLFQPCPDLHNTPVITYFPAEQWKNYQLFFHFFKVMEAFWCSIS